MRACALLLAVLFLPAAAHAQWVREAPVPTPLGVTGVAMPTPSRLIVVTGDNTFDDAGAYHTSADGGATWTSPDAPNSPGAGFNGAFFLDAANGWLYGNDSFRTTDGGATWTPMDPLGSTYGMRFATPLLGVATGNFGAAISRDGGATWAPAPHDLVDLRMAADGLRGLGLGDGLWRTLDGAQTFTQVATGEAFDAALVGAAGGVAILDGRFARTVDGGATWTDAGDAGPYERLSVAGGAVLAWEPSRFGTGAGQMARSTDGGASWTALGDVVPDGIRAITVASSQTLVALSATGDLWRSGDSGATWTRTYASRGAVPFSFGEIAPAFADAFNGFVGMGQGHLLRTTDGGQTWAPVSSGVGQTLADVARFADGTLIAVGAEGTVVTRGADGRWTLRPVPNANLPFTPAPLVAVHVTGAASAVALDNAGGVFATSDRGVTWSALGAVTGLSSLADIHLDGDAGYVVGGGFGVSALWRTTDGGATWVPVTGDEPPQGQFVSVDAEGDVAWAARFDGLLWRTADGGATWTTAQITTDGNSVSDVEFWDAATGYAVGYNGRAYRTADGGATWSELPTPNTTDHFSDLHVVGPNEAWMSTRGGVAYYTATAGQNWAVIPVGGGGFGGYEAIVATTAGSAWTVGESGEVRYFAGPPPPPDNRPPEAAFSFVATRLSVAFADESTDPDGVIVSRAWDFGDGATSTEANPTHVYAEAGTYIVRLTVTDDDGATAETVRFPAVSPGPGGTFGGFTEVTPFASPFVTPQEEDFWIASGASADVDLDGDLDVVMLGYYVVYNQSVEERLTLLRNDGPGADDEWAFTVVDLPLPDDVSSGRTDLAFGDYDGDGDADLVIGSDAQTLLYRNDAGALSPTDVVLPPYFEDNNQADFDLRSITWADTDNDGDLDLLIPSVPDFDTFTYRTALMRNDGGDGAGGWTFTEVESGLAPTDHAQSTWADADGDGDLDLLLVNVAPFTDRGFVRLYRNDGGNVFVGTDLFDGFTLERGQAEWGDADGDGDLDVLVVGNVQESDGTFRNTMRLFRNDGAGAYASEDILACDFVCGDRWLDLLGATWADYDSDGAVDILLHGSVIGGDNIEGQAAVFLNDGAGTFTVSEGDLPAPRAGGTRGGTFSWLDLENDGDLDYVVAGDYFVPGGNGLIESQIHVYRNDAEGDNAAPATPGNLTATVGADGRVALAWTAPADDTTPSDALTFDLAVTRNGAPAIVRLLPQPGTLGAVTGWSLAGLPDGTYTVALRAVDTAFNGGPAAEATFTVGTIATEGTGAFVTALADAAPNPTTGATTVRFSLAATGRASLGVYDVLGRHVATLADGDLAAGPHEVAWDARGLAAGTYVVRLVAGDAALVRRVTVVR